MAYASHAQGTKKSAPMLRFGRKKNEPGTMPGSLHSRWRLGLSVGVRHRKPPAGWKDPDENDRVFARTRQVDRGRDVRIAPRDGRCEAPGGHVDDPVRCQAAHRGLEGCCRVDSTG